MKVGKEVSKLITSLSSELVLSSVMTFDDVFPPELRSSSLGIVYKCLHFGQKFPSCHQELSADFMMSDEPFAAAVDLRPHRLWNVMNLLDLPL